MPSRQTRSKDQARPSPEQDWLLLDQQLCFALYASSLAMTKRYKPLLAPLGLTYPQYLVMLALWECDGASVSTLGQRLQLDSGTLTPLLKRLESNGLIQRRRSSEDERRVEIFLQPEGRSLKRRAKPIPAQLACASACSLQELSELTQRLHRLRSELQASDTGR
ncbi:DNA-binding MarR family transcriptional regulator [Paucibacter oligotrophus]|uniref:DNA-binding MarR family transcriptional regulator n=1 Tax=Roseateles oligotrophus TaxID=1769250 RepID=A0A840LBS1_9BURK|nr:MarR family transcriptional regulator [Roseateles oligotrophus]MBB4844102.1 DNA-binding MarR family transcriptional regulator [Roseateles oligotrophus]